MALDQQSGVSNRRDVLRATGAGVSVCLTLGIAGCLGGNTGTSGGNSENYPQQTITWINPSGPAGGFGSTSFAIESVLPNHLPNTDTDIAVESIGDWDQGTQQIHNAEPDGYTVGWGNVPGQLIPQIIGDLNYDMSQWSWIGRVQQSTYSVYVPVDSQFESFEQVQNADQVNIGRFGGTGTLVNILGLNKMDVNYEVVPGYEGGDGAYAGLLRGDIDVLCYARSSTLPQKGIRDGEIRPLATFGDEIPSHYEEAGYGDIPTVADLGFDSLANFGLNRLVGAPPGLDEEIRSILEEALLATLDDEEFLSWAEENNYPVHPGDGTAAQEAVDNGVSLIEENSDFLSQYYG